MYHNYNSNEEILKTGQIRSFQGKDAKEVAQLIKSSLLNDNKEELFMEKVESLVKDYDTDKILEINSYSKIYVMIANKNFEACGIISRNLEEDSILLTIFVSPHSNRKAVSKEILKCLQKDEYYINARRIEMVSSKAACKYYQKMECMIKKELQHVSA